MPTTRFDDAVTALVAAYTASAALAGVAIYDGDAVTARADQDFIIAGHDGSPSTAPARSPASRPPGNSPRNG